MVWRQWNATRSDHQGTQANYPHIRRNCGFAHEGSSRCSLPRSPRPNPAQPENMQVKFNVDVKVQNDPDRLFALMHNVISAYANWETALAPRILLGMWHPRFLGFAKGRLPYCRRSYIGNSTHIARKYFWDDCDAFSMWFGSLTTTDGQK